MHWLIAFHIIFLVTWFSGLFYLPRLYVYHTQSSDSISQERFKIMEKKLYYYITTPGAILTTISGLLLFIWGFDKFGSQGWIYVKMFLVLFLWIYHGYLGCLLKQFRVNNNKHSEKFYRILNEIPTIFLIVIVILAEVKPF